MNTPLFQTTVNYHYLLYLCPYYYHDLTELLGEMAYHRWQQAQPVIATQYAYACAVRVTPGSDGYQVELLPSHTERPRPAVGKKYRELTEEEQRVLRPLCVRPATTRHIADWRTTREPPTSFHGIDYDLRGDVTAWIILDPCATDCPPVLWGVMRAGHAGIYKDDDDHPDAGRCDLATAADRLAALGYDPAALIIAMCYYRPDLVPENLLLPNLANTKKR